jgi:hypothetical protein
MNYLLMTIYLAFNLIFVVDYLRTHYDPLNSLFKSRLSFNCILRIFELKCASQVFPSNTYILSVHDCFKFGLSI